MPVKSARSATPAQKHREYTNGHAASHAGVRFFVQCSYII